MSVPTTTQRIITMLTERSKAGLAKYGVTIDRDDLTFEQWATHAQEEMLDGGQYLERAKAKWREREEEISRLREEIKKAWMEGYVVDCENWCDNDERFRELQERNWNNSRAKRVAEGKENK